MRYLSFFMIILLLVSINARAEEQWVLKKDSDGIKVYTLQGADELVTYKGVTEIDAPMAVIAEVIKDIPSYPQWYWQCKETRVLKSDQGNRSVVYYFITHPGWPVADRDFILFNNQVGDPKNQEMAFALGTITDELVPRQDGMVRLKNLTGGWSLKKIGTNKTGVTLLMKTDTGGSVPISLARLVATDTPFMSLKALRRMAAMDKYYLLAGIPKGQ